MAESDRKYFAEYTGIEQWGRALRPHFSGVHETRVRINYTYYNSPSLMKRIFDWYDAIDPDGTHFDYSVIDDGSQITPITELDYPKYWSVLRIEEDHGWNNEGARNCLMRYTSNNWNLLMDSDWVITLKNLKRIKRAVNTRWLDRDIAYMPGNYGPACMRNSFMITKKEYWRRGGYDQAFIGYHGNDYSFLKMTHEYDFSDFFRFARICFDVVDPKEKQRTERVKEYHQLLIDLEEKGFGYRDKTDKQDFTWTNQEEHKKMWKHLEFIVINQ